MFARQKWRVPEGTDRGSAEREGRETGFGLVTAGVRRGGKCG